MHWPPTLLAAAVVAGAYGLTYAGVDPALCAVGFAASVGIATRALDWDLPPAEPVLGLQLGSVRGGLWHTWKAMALWGSLAFLALGAALLWAIDSGLERQTFDALPRDFRSPEGARWFLWYGLVKAPIFEEILWRGVVLRLLAQGLGPRVGLGLSALLFWVMHWVGWGVTTPPNQLLAGGILGWAYLRTDLSLLAPILLHAAGNLLVMGWCLLWMVNPPWLLRLLGW